MTFSCPDVGQPTGDLKCDVTCGLPICTNLLVRIDARRQSGIENVPGDVVGIDVKAAASISGGDFKGLNKPADATGTAFKLGVVLYDGELSLPFGERMYAAPVSCLSGK